MSKDNGGPAFPFVENKQDETYQWVNIQHHGVSLRDYFAAKAMQGLLASNWNGTGSDLAQHSYALANDMLEASNK